MHSSSCYTSILMLLFLVIADSASPQNLVRNCDLELTLGCPTGHGQLEYCKYWASPGDGTSDYLHACNNDNFSVPVNQFGNQAAHSGDAYAHLISYYPQSGQYREYMRCMLACSLEGGKTYAVSFYISTSDDSKYAIDGFGAHFTVAPLEQPLDGVINLPGDPHISNPAGYMLDEKDSWVRISGMYTAQGGERYFTIGNFKYNNELTIQDFPTWETRFASYYVDDISVDALEPLVELGNDTTICPNDSLFFDFSGICSNAILNWENGSEDMIRWISDEGTYSLSGTIGCTNYYDNITISHSPDPGNFLPPDTVICPGKTVDLIPLESFSIYEWQDGSNIPIYTADHGGRYWLNVINQYGCSFSDTLQLFGLTEPNFDLGNDVMICIGEEVLLDPGIDSAFHHFYWSDYSTGTTLVTIDSGEYWVEIINPCGDMTDHIFIHTQNCTPAFAAPNAFTPNGDGMNDQFMVKSENINNLKVLIYDRWGRLLFESNDPTKGWDGNINGSMAPAGSYVWMAIYDIRKDDNSYVTEKMKGTVVLIH